MGEIKLDRRMHESKGGMKGEKELEDRRCRNVG